MSPSHHTSLKKFFIITSLVMSFILSQNTSLAAVAHDGASESHTGTTGSANQASFSWTHTPSGNTRGVIVYVFTISATKTVTGVTYGGTAMTEIVGGTAVDTSSELGRIDTFFLGSSIPTGPQSIVVSRTNNATVMYATAATVTAGVNTEIYTPGIVLLQENGAYSVQSVTDGSTGVNSVRYAAGYSGSSNVLGVGTGSTALNNIDFGSFTANMARETTAGQGARNVGFTYTTSDDRAAVHLAVREIPATATLSASPTICTILSGASACNIPFTWNIANAPSPNLYNGTTASAYSTAASGTDVSYPITNGANTIQARNSATVLSSISVTGGCDTGTIWNGSICAISPITTIADGASPTNTTIAPSAGATDLDYFTLQTNTGGDTITAVTITLSPLGAFNNITQVGLTDNSNVARCTAVNNPVSNTISFTTCASNGGIAVSSSATTYKVRITPKTHVNMPLVPGAEYATTGTVTSFTSTNTQVGVDSSSATVTIDNLSPSNASSVNGSAGSAQVTLSWTNPVDSDYATQVVLRRATSAVADSPVEGSAYTVGNTIDTAVVACVIATPAETCTDTGLTNGTAYHYKIFSKDSNGNYGTGVVPTASPFTPATTTFDITSSAGTNGTIVPSGTTSVAEGSSQLYTLVPNFGYDVATLIVDSVSIATTTSYTFTNVQAPHTISATFSLLPVSYAIVSTAGAGGTINPLGTTNVGEGASQAYTITPDTGYNISTLVVDGQNLATSTSYVFSNVTAPHTIAVTFVLIPPPPGSFSIMASAGANGTIIPSGATTIAQGGSQSYTITPSSGYYIETLTVDSVSIATTTSYTFTNVQMNHTIEATFEAMLSPVNPPLSSDNTGAGRPATITFLGKAFPKGIVQIVDKTLNDERLFEQKDIIGESGSFSVSFVGIFQTLHSFGLIVKDALGRSSQTKFFTIDTRSDDFTIKNILTPPTIDIIKGQVSRGSNALVTGYASPKHIVQIKLDGIIKDKIITEKDGSYLLKLPTGELAFGQHKVQAIQIDPISEKESDLSLSRSFFVSRLSVVQADLSGDGKIDIRDWSIFLSRWISKDSLLRESIDLNEDGKINITDFSIFVKTIRR